MSNSPNNPHYFQAAAQAAPSTIPGAPQFVGPISDAHLKFLIRAAVEDVRSSKDAELMKNIDKRFDTMTETFLSAFPNQDPGEHRKAHEREIASAEGWRRIRNDIFSKLLQGGVWALAVWLLMAVWESFRSGVHK